MSTGVDRTGTFRCSPIETGVGKTPKQELPQFLAEVRLLELWDEDTETWVPWAEYEQEASVYAILFYTNKKTNKKEPTLTHTQVSKVFSWDGTDFTYLAETDFSDLKFQVRIENNDPDYADKNPYVVNWIDEYDAVPGRKIKKLDAAGVKDLNKQFALLLKATGKKAAPAKAPSKVPEVPETDESKPDLPSPKKAGKKAAPTKAPPKVPPKVPTIPGIPEGKCTKQEAWETAVELKNDDCSDEQLKAAWLAAIAATVPEDIAEKAITPEQWFVIKDAVLNDVGKF